MSETTENARRWNGYVCPDCRFVFRVPRDHDGKGIVCPSCRRMLRIPGADDTPPPLTRKGNLKVNSLGSPESGQRGREKAPAAAEISPPVYKTAVPDPEANRLIEKKRRRPETQEEEQPNWDKTPGQRVRVGGGQKNNYRNLIVIAVMVLITLLSAIGFVVLRDRSQKPVVSAPLVAPVPAADAQPQETVADAIELPLEMNRNETVLLAELEPLTKKFFEATTVDEMLPLIRNRALMEPKLRKFYANGRIEAPGISTFNASGSVAYRAKLASLSVRTREFELKQVAYIRTAEGMKIDWESYVGWSEMPWADFLAKKPTQPVLFRATLKEVEYYNFSFSDDRKWESFQFRSPDTESVLYGYTKRDSPESGKLRLSDPKSTSLVTVRLKFLPGETSKNQVIVDSVVADGWVEGIEEK